MLKILRISLIFFASLACNCSYAQVYINEFMASNSVYWDPDKQAYSDWIELYNKSNDTIDLSGYFLTDNLARPNKWALPNGSLIAPKGYLLVWADNKNEGLHTSFNLNIRREELGLYDPGLVEIDALQYGSQYRNLTYGRIGDGSKNWGYLLDATPGARNVETGSEALKFSPAPQFSLAGGFVEKGAILKLTCSNSSAAIRYTLDGSEVTTRSTSYQGQLVLDSSVTFKVKVFDDDLVPSQTATRTFITDTPSQLPLVSVVTDPTNLWDDQKGIYVVGKNGRKGQGDTVIANYWQNWERPASVEMYEPNGELAFVSRAEIKLISPYARKFPQKPISIKFDEVVNHQIFPGKEANLFKSISLRNAGDDMAYTFFRDGMMQSLLAGQMDIDYQGYRPAVVYLNGQYWGIYNIREKANKDYLFTNHHVDRGNANILEDGTSQVIRGSSDKNLALRAFVINNDLSVAKNYEYVKAEIDVDAYINYMIAEIYVNNLDWPDRNIKYWRTHDSGSKWRWIISDLDFGFGLYRGYGHNTLAHAASDNSVMLGRSVFPLTTLLFRKLLDNEDFRGEFIQRFAGYLATTFAPERVISLIDSIKGHLAEDMVVHIAKWKDLEGIPSLMSWEENIEIVREFGRERSEYQMQHLMEQFNLKGTVELEIQATNGRVMINGLSLPKGTFHGTFFKGVELRMTAIPEVGYLFAGWSGSSDEASGEIHLTPSGSLALKANFERTSESVLPAEIKTNLTLTKDQSPYVAISDVVVGPKATLTVEPGVVIRMPDKGDLIVRGALNFSGKIGDSIIIEANKKAGFDSWGAICLDGPLRAVNLSYVVIKDATHGSDQNVYVGAIGGHHADISLEHSRIDDVFGTPFYTEFGATEIRYCKMHTRVSSDIINIKYGKASVEFCDLAGNSQPNTDGIDYDRVSEGVIRGNKIYDFRGGNSDGIDLGEGTSNVLIEKNRIINCSDKGISIGQKATAKIYRNVIIGCFQGVGIKDSSSFALIDKCIFYKNKTGIAVFEKNNNRGGGGVAIINTIISQSTKASIYADAYSVLDISYSLSDMDVMKGRGNLYADPLFKSPGTGVFTLSDGSPCFNAGNPQSFLDFGLTREHIGMRLEKRKIKMHWFYFLLLAVLGVAALFVFGK
ncbi:MAG: CotH kinase family protein [Flavobacteriales bacterium]|nr:CotH kinase family protein [Flavobacteriales bacterium]